MESIKTSTQRKSNGFQNTLFGLLLTIVGLITSLGFSWYLISMFGIRFHDDRYRGIYVFVAVVVFILWFSPVIGMELMKRSNNQTVSNKEKMAQKVAGFLAFTFGIPFLYLVLMAGVHFTKATFTPVTMVVLKQLPLFDMATRLSTVQISAILFNYGCLLLGYFLTFFRDLANKNATFRLMLIGSITFTIVYSSYSIAVYPRIEEPNIRTDDGYYINEPINPDGLMFD